VADKLRSAHVHSTIYIVQALTCIHTTASARNSCLKTMYIPACRQQLAAEATRAEAAAVAAAEADAVWQEVLMQTEEDLDKRAETDSGRLAMLQRTAEEVRSPILPYQRAWMLQLPHLAPPYQVQFTKHALVCLAHCLC
jgi:hypothetical protein